MTESLSVALVGVLLWGSAAFAQSPSPAPIQGSIEVVTDVPILVGVRPTVYVPGRLHWAGTVGFMPRGYLQLVDSISVSAGWYDPITADLIEAALGSALIVRNHIGWQPFQKHGFFFEAGHGVAFLGGGLVVGDLLGEATGQFVPPTLAGRGLRVNTVVQQLDVALGWRFEVAEHVLVRLDIGGAFTIASSTRIQPEGGELPFSGPFLREGEDYLDSTLKKYVHTPTIGIGIGYR